MGPPCLIYCTYQIPGGIRVNTKGGMDMARLYFIYSTMDSGKSLDLLKSAHNYESQDKNVLLFTTEKDTRCGKISSNATTGIISTRLGLKREAYLIERVDAFRLAQDESPHCIFVDEAQFIDEKYILILANIVDMLNIPVICYGLKNDFKNNLFEGSRALLLYADKIQELKTVCIYCNKKATMNMRVIDGNPEFEGEQIKIGGNESYKPVCRCCYMKFKRKAIKKIE